MVRRHGPVPCPRSRLAHPRISLSLPRNQDFTSPTWRDDVQVTLSRTLQFERERVAMVR